MTALFDTDECGARSAVTPRYRCGRPRWHTGPHGEWIVDPVTDTPPLPDPVQDMPGKVRADHPDTSRQAAAEVLPRSGTQRRRVLDFVRQMREGVTDLDIQMALQMSGNTERPRRVELVEAGWVVDSGERRLVDGRPMIVWKAVR